MSRASVAASDGAASVPNEAAPGAAPSVAAQPRTANAAPTSAPKPPANQPPASATTDAGTVVHEEYGNGDTPAAARFASQPEVVFVAVVCAVATIALGIYPGPLFDVAQDAGNAFKSLL